MRILAVVCAGFITSSLSVISYSETSDKFVRATPGKRIVRWDVTAEGSSLVSMPLLRTSPFSGGWPVWGFRVGEPERRLSGVAA